MNPRAALRAPYLLASDVVAARRPPILLAGLPRSGSSWTGNVLATGASMRYYREPCNAKWQRWAEPFQFRYVRADDSDYAFDSYIKAAFEGRIGGPAVEKHKWDRYKRSPTWPGRILVKEVHTVLALERMEQVASPQVVVIVRHPCALASSWARLRKDRPNDPMWRGVDEHIAALQGQPQLVTDHLEPYMDVLSSAETYLEKVGALWGAMYKVMLQQAATRPGWIVVTHETLSGNPDPSFRVVFERLGVRWTDLTTRTLATTTTRASDKPYETLRISKDEPEKWKSELSDSEAQEVLSGARPFGIGMYPELED